jgi:hypothetical protein
MVKLNLYYALGVMKCITTKWHMTERVKGIIMNELELTKQIIDIFFQIKLYSPNPVYFVCFESNDTIQDLEKTKDGMLIDLEKFKKETKNY